MKKKIVLIILSVVLLAGAGGVWYVYSKAFSNNVNLPAKTEKIIFLPTGGNIQNIYDTLQKYDLLKNTGSFRMLAGYKNLEKKYKAGRYVIKAGMSNNALVNMFASGRQSPVKITFNNIRTREELAQRVGSQLECGKDALFEILNDEKTAEKYGLNKDNFLVIFIPNTYEIYWNTSAEQFVVRMHTEWEKFWNNDRKKKAEAIGLTPAEVSVLASIVQGETNKTDEMDEIAGLYINRLKKGWKLEADPTVKFAVGDFTITRVLKKHLECESPYNTYRHEGLPPGPISLPDVTVIDKVLNYAHHNYMFMCAKEDLSGYHNFAVTNAQHEANARKYRIAYAEWARKKKASGK
ncbi:Endolytic murein transglycosylase [bioreactor metagenome]|uniref:Endolytic murein transglycosylase n=1 Tax=bioreactor metagenome TaxID=1076179 RepID=A0A644XME2_9ZZZZ